MKTSDVESGSVQVTKRAFRLEDGWPELVLQWERHLLTAIQGKRGV